MSRRVSLIREIPELEELLNLDLVVSGHTLKGSPIGDLAGAAI